MHTQSIAPIFISMSLSFTISKISRIFLEEKRWLRALNSDRKNKEMCYWMCTVWRSVLFRLGVLCTRLGALLPVTADSSPCQDEPTPSPDGLQL